MAISAQFVDEGSVVPFSGYLFDEVAAEKLLKDTQELVLLRELNAILLEQDKAVSGLMIDNLKDQVKNLKEQLTLTEKKLEIEKLKGDLEKSRAEFYKEQSIAKDKIIEQHQQLEEKMLKDVRKKQWWQFVAVGELFVVIAVIVGLIL